MEKEGDVITQDNHPDIYNWLSKNVLYYEEYQKHYTLTSEGEINAYWDVYLSSNTTEFKHPFGYVKGGFNCYCCKNLTSLIGSPKEVGGSFNCEDCSNLTSLIGSPKKVGGYFDCYNCDSITSLIGLPKKIKNEFYFTLNYFSNRPKDKEQYRFYLAMWLELFESVSNKDRKEYITNYKDKKDYDNDKPIIPVEILKEYGF